MSKQSTQQYVYDYPRPAVTVDIVIVTKTKRRKVLLIRRKNAPFQGSWAIPGGFVDMDESLEQAARRELLEETGVKATRLEQLHTFGEPERDPRSRVISVVYLAEVDPDKVRPVAADDAEDVGWFSLTSPPALAFDHAKILKLAKKRLQQKMISAP